MEASYSDWRSGRGPTTALLFGTPFLVWALVTAARRGRFGATLGWLATGSVPGVVGFFVYNWAVTGDATEVPFRLLDPSDTLGFGSKRLEAIGPYTNYTTGKAWRATGGNLSLLVLWSSGGLVLVLLAIVGFMVSTRRTRLVLSSLLVTWIGGYFFFWGAFSYIYAWNGGRFLGPFYYMPALIPMVVFGAIGFDEVLRRSTLLAMITGVLCVALTLPVLIDAVDSNRARTDKREHVEEVVDAAVGSQRALVFIQPVWGPFLQNPFSFWRNKPANDGRIVYALDRGAKNADVVRAFPDAMHSL